MKRVIAFILSISYLVFISATVWTVEDLGDYSFASTFISEKSAASTSLGKDVKTSLLNKLKTFKFNKIVKHLAGGGKTKVPRAGLAPAAFANFIFGPDLHHEVLAVRIITPQLYTNPIFLQNGVLRI